MLIDTNTFNDLLLLIINKNTSQNRQLALEILDHYNNQPKLSNDNNDLYDLYTNLLTDVINGNFEKSKNKNDITVLFNKYKANKKLTENKLILDNLQYILLNDEEVSDKLLDMIDKKLRNLVTWFRCNKQIRSMFGYANNINIDSDENLISNKFQKLIDMSRDIESSIRNVQSQDKLYIERIVSDKRDTIKNAFSLYKRRNVTGSIITGLQGLNKMCGKRESFKLGESIMFCALTHHYKSMMLLSMARWIKEYNTFDVRDGKKPLVLFISLENEAHENLLLWYKRMYHSLTNEYDITSVSEKEIIDKIYNYFAQNNVTFIIDRYLPGDFGYNELVNLVNDFEDKGYYIVACIIDYLSQMKKNYAAMSKGAGNYVLLKNLYNATCNFLSSKGICLLTGHQLNRGASEIVSSGIPYPVKRFGENHLADAIDVGREIDFIIYMHIEKNHLGESYLTLKWGKHRYNDDTKEIDKFCAYKFSEIGIIDDYGKKSTFIRNIYNGDNPDKEGKSKELNIY